MVLLMSAVGSVYAQDDKRDNTDYYSSGSIDPDNPNKDKIVDVLFKSDVIEENTIFAVELIAPRSIVGYYLAGEGILVVKESSGAKNIDLSLLAEEEFGALAINIDYGGGEYWKQYIYTYTAEGRTFISDTGRDTAWRRGLEYRCENGLISLAEKEAECRLFNQRLITDVVTSKTKSRGYIDGISVYGELSWIWSHGIYSGVKPLKFAKLELYELYNDGYGNFSEILLGETYSDAGGHYEIEVENKDSCEVFLRIYPESTTFRVTAYTFGYFDYHMDTSTIFAWRYWADELNFVVMADNGDDAYKALYVCQGVVVGQRYVLDMGLSVGFFSPKVNVYFPTAYSGGGDVVNISANDWDMWDTHSHEYGHAIQYRIGIWGSVYFAAITPPSGFTHKIETDHFSDGIAATYGKVFAMECAYIEAWATAFCQVAQEKYKNEYLGIPHASDGLAFQQVVINYNSVPQSGEAQEIAIAASLWHLYEILGYQGFWNATTQYGTNTLPVLISKLDAQYPQYRNQIGLSLGKHQIAPSNFQVTNRLSVSSTTPPAFVWRNNGSTAYPHDKFDLVFCDSSGNTVVVVSYLTSSAKYSDYVTYTLDSSTWSAVLAYFGNNSSSAISKVIIRGYLSALSPESGPYPSAYAT